MSTYVLIAGAYCGGWVWDALAKQMRDAGHVVLTPTLTGLADKAGLATPEIGLQHHVDDVVSVVLSENITDIIIVGHSYGGIVADAVSERIPEKIKKIVYLDAIVLEPGESFLDLSRSISAERTLLLENLVKEKGDGWRVPIFIAAQSGHDLRLTPHLFKTFKDPLVLTRAESMAIAREYIYCTNKSDMKTFDLVTPSYLRAKKRGYVSHELSSLHMPMWTRTKELLLLL